MAKRYEIFTVIFASKIGVSALVCHKCLFRSFSVEASDQRGPNLRTGSNLFAIEKTSRRRPIAGKIFNWYFIFVTFSRLDLLRSSRFFATFSERFLQHFRPISATLFGRTISWPNYLKFCVNCHVFKIY